MKFSPEGIYLHAWHSPPLGQIGISTTSYSKATLIPLPTSTSFCGDYLRLKYVPIFEFPKNTDLIIGDRQKKRFSPFLKE